MALRVAQVSLWGLRTPDGKWSPAAFSPKPAAPASQPAPPQYPLPPFGTCLHFHLALEVPIRSGAAPKEAARAHDEKGLQFLALLSPAASRLVAVSLPETALSPLLSNSKPQLQQREGAVYAGLLGSSAKGPSQQGAHGHAQVPAQRADSAHSGSDASMDCGSEAEGEQASPPISAEQASSNDGPDVQALGAALEQAPEARQLRDAVGGQVTADLKDGGQLRVQLPLTPSSPLPRAALDALSDVLPAASWHQLLNCHLDSTGACCGRWESEWQGLSDTLLKWAWNPRLLSPRLPRFTSGSQTTTEVALATTPGGSVDSAATGTAFAALLQSRLHRSTMSSGQYRCFKDSHPATAPCTSGDPALGHYGCDDTAEHLAEVRLAVLGLHSVYEDFKLNVLRWRLLPTLGQLLLDLAAMLNAQHFVDHYQRDLGPGSQPCTLQRLPGDVLALDPAAVQAAVQSAQPDQRPAAAASAARTAAHSLILATVQQGLTLADLETVPPGLALFLRQAQQRGRASPPAGWPAEAYVLVGREEIAATRTQHTLAAHPLQSSASALGKAMDEHPRAEDAGTDSSRLEDIVPGVARAVGIGLPPRHSLASPTARTPVLGTTAQARSRFSRQTGGIMSLASARDGPQSDGMEGLEQGPARLRFSHDSRLSEVRRLLCTALPGPIRLAQAHTGGDTELVLAQQARLMAVAVRTMGLPIGRGALALGTLRPLTTEALAIPALSLAGRLPEQHNAIINLDLAAATPAPGGGAAADFTAWPEFHNGVASGLRLAPGAMRLTRAWIVFNKPPSPTYTHAGMLMGLGLSGQLACLSATDIYRYLSQEHEATTIGLLLGLAAAHRATLDPTTSKMLFLHVPSKHPVTYPELELSPLVQAAALLGVGLVYQGSGHRLTAEVMIDEISKRPGPNFHDLGYASRSSHHRVEGSAIGFNREGYALAAGLALGLITLGQGLTLGNLADLNLPERLRYLMVGTSDPGSLSSCYPPRSAATNAISKRWHEDILSNPLDGALARGLRFGSGLGPHGPGEHGHSSAQQQGPSQVTLEGNLVNLDVTSPASTLALGLMFLKTNHAPTAAFFTVPSTRYALDLVRPDFIMLRVLAKNLVMWDSLQPTGAWLSSQLPDIIKGPISKWNGPKPAAGLGSDPDEDLNDPFEPALDNEAAAQAHINALAGACLALGIKYAGTGDDRARALLHNYVLYFLSAKQRAPDPVSGAAAVWGMLDKQALENCMGVVVMSLAIVMAGTGHLPTFKLLRALRKRLSPSGSVPNSGAVFHGNHMMIAMALGFLFMGGGNVTLSTSNQAVAALLISLFPRFPVAPTDNRCHLQAFRHLYVLATESRSLQAVDIASGTPVHVPLHTSRAAHKAPGQAMPASADVSIMQQEPIDASVELQGPASEPLKHPAWRGKLPEGEQQIQQTAPFLLPETDEAAELRVAGPRYWHQDLQGGKASVGGAGKAAAGPCSARTVYVQRRQGVLSYAEDPSGMRTLLNGMLQDVDTGHKPQQAGLGLVEQCAASSSSAFLRSFAQAFCQVAPFVQDRQSGTRAGGRGPDEDAQSSTEGEVSVPQRFQRFCIQILHECVTQDKVDLIPSFLQLHSLVHGLTGDTQQAAGVKALCGNLPPTLPLLDLRLALAFADSSATHETDESLVMSHRFLRSLEASIGSLWQRLGFVGERACSADGVIRRYLQSGQLPQQLPPEGGAQAEGDNARHAELFAAYCAA
ncbi:hypothetical protein WJX73_002436 [Symbiochloris irregularis]|uniref:Anaphase-promoting complex subunit 1 n=1 Tax=Symbiochloris irregularis TaxID=706552 RepID=A0AAW1NXM0_9CHLO